MRMGKSLKDKPHEFGSETKNLLAISCPHGYLTQGLSAQSDRISQGRRHHKPALAMSLQTGSKSLDSPLKFTPNRKKNPIQMVALSEPTTNRALRAVQFKEKQIKL